MNYNASHHLFKCIRLAVPFCIVIALAVALKRYYSLAEADGLVWILAPTARCVELVTGIPFVYEQGTGFMNLDHRAVIAPACAGINFMIIVFCMVSFSLIRSSREGKARLLFIPAAIGAAYVLTILVNSLRISLAVYLYDTDLHFGWFTLERIHQLEGTLVYFVSLCSIYAIVTHVVRRIRISGRTQRDNKARAPAETAWRFMAPTAWYLAVTLAVPLVIGKQALYGRLLLEHALFVLAIPLLVIAGPAFCRFFHGMLRSRRHGNEAVL
jgi:exosortase K